mmetsp:Transcript_55978/g.130865  ORF Transcript_55978/g.130865 Transcript_55978/m.130865 type:complete len:169 (+) Transcript_55978:85-591(+)
MGCHQSVRVANINAMEAKITNQYSRNFRSRVMTDKKAPEFSDFQPVMSFMEEGGKPCSSAGCVKVLVPQHLNDQIKQEVGVLEKIPARRQLSWSSWTMAGVLEQAPELPSDKAVAPDKDDHDKHVKKLETFLEQVRRSAKSLDGRVRSKRLESRLDPLPPRLPPGRGS